MVDNPRPPSPRTKFPWPLPSASSCGSPTQGVPKKLRTLRDWIERKPLRWEPNRGLSSAVAKAYSFITT
jgi:hypothetical protein